MPTPAAPPSLPFEKTPERIRTLFDGIAGAYDLLNDVISFGVHRAWKRRACAALQLKPGQTALDVCTGTGGLLPVLLSHVGPQGQVIGLDFSPGMLAVAARQLGDNPAVTLVEGDAMALPFEDAVMDSVIISFGLRNVMDPAACVAELVRVVRPGGWVVCLDSCSRPSLPGFWLYFEKIMPWLGALIARDKTAYQYLSMSTKAFAPPDVLKQMFHQAGCQRVNVSTLLFGAAVLVVGQRDEVA
jgi:demethylmenaquinone methyltransferase / 2-methoxy-6-polyprenyl-1,4-benzoquinol methylase